MERRLKELDLNIGEKSTEEKQKVTNSCFQCLNIQLEEIERIDKLIKLDEEKRIQSVQLYLVQICDEMQLPKEHVDKLTEPSFRTSLLKCLEDGNLDVLKKLRVGSRCTFLTT